MADDLDVTPGSGKKVATKDLVHGSNPHAQTQIFILGTHDGTTLTELLTGDPFPFSLPITRTETSIWSSTTLVASTPLDSTGQVVAGARAVTLNLEIINGVSGPSTPPRIQILVSNNGSKFYNHGNPYINTANSGDTLSVGGIELPLGIHSFKLIGSGNTVQDVTVNADFVMVTY